MTDFGARLREARERRGIALRQIANNTKISVGVLEALERNDISKLPGGIFGRAFVRSYAIEVGLDPDETVRAFIERFESEPTVPVAPRRTISEEESSFESQQRMASVLLKLILVSIPLAGALLYYTLRTRPRVEAPASTPVAAASEVAPSAPAAAARSETVRLEIHPTAACWVVLTVDGERLFGRLMQAGEREVRDVRTEALIEIGDAGAFAYSIDGRPGKPLGAAGQVTTVRITRETAADYVR